MKADVVAEAANFNQRVLVSGETDDFKVIDIWLTLEGAAAIQTPKDVYNALVAEGYKVDYLRVPMTDEKAPKVCNPPPVCSPIVQRERDWWPHTGGGKSLAFNHPHATTRW